MFAFLAKDYARHIANLGKHRCTADTKKAELMLPAQVLPEPDSVLDPHEVCDVTEPQGLKNAQAVRQIVVCNPQP